MTPEIAPLTLITVTVYNPADGKLSTVTITEAKHRLRYGWRYATYDECLQARNRSLTA